jgi:MFS transporter, PHS family, inorganic phosphate transporter
VSILYILNDIAPSLLPRFAAKKWRGAMMAAVFAMQGFGQLAGALVMLFVTLGFKKSLLTATTYATCTGGLWTCG